MLGGAVVVALAAVWCVPQIKATYPVYRKALDGAGVDVALALFLTAGVILTTELFYRGILLFAAERWLGVAAVYAVLPVYVADHLGAPPAEVIASVAAGALLGHLALATRSLWPGFVVHAACALAVDLGSIGTAAAAGGG
jgi:membrane protease YdiL (CAAX protease family)